MSKKNKKNIIKETERGVPEIRFLEFENDGEWEIKKLGELLEFKNGINAKKEQYGRGIKFINVLDIIQNDFITYDVIIGSVDITDNEVVKNEVNYGDILFQRSSETQEEAGQANVYLDTGKTAVFGGFVIRGKKKGDYVPIFINYLLKSSGIRKQIISKSAGSTRFNVGQDILSEIKIPFPILDEQQKIADCLSSLDDLIGAETEKLECLKDHKKGLLQQLFPAEGEIVPKLRFPEFENDGEWTASPLNKISSSIFDGTHQTPKYTEDGIPFFSVENIISGSKNKFISREAYDFDTRKNKPEYGDLLITRIGNIGTPKVVDWKYEFGIYVTLAVIKKSEKFDSTYLCAYIQSSRFQKEIHRRSLLEAAPCKINMDELRMCEILLPPTRKEQEQISNCVASIENALNAQIERIESFKNHKKGLMQQLFPNVSEL